MKLLNDSVVYQYIHAILRCGLNISNSKFCPVTSLNKKSGLAMLTLNIFSNTLRHSNSPYFHLLFYV